MICPTTISFTLPIIIVIVIDLFPEITSLPQFMIMLTIKIIA